eukprot:5791114-Pyramimonas_sp.AAC.1
MAHDGESDSWGNGIMVSSSCLASGRRSWASGPSKKTIGMKTQGVAKRAAGEPQGERGENISHGHAWTWSSLGTRTTE